MLLNPAGNQFVIQLVGKRLTRVPLGGDRRLKTLDTVRPTGSRPQLPGTAWVAEQDAVQISG